MKLAASILIASVNAQERFRENKEADDSPDTGSTFADYFGGYDYGGGFDGGVFDYSGFDDQAFGDYNDAFGTDAPTTAAAATTQAPTDAPTEDPFAGYDFSGADDAFASYDGADDSASLDDTVADIVADVVEAAAGRPDAPSQQEAEKSSSFLQSLNTIAAGGTDGNGIAYCFISEGNNDTSGTTATEDWFNNGGQWVNCPSGENEACQITISKTYGVITRVQSQCANASSCVANMRQNFAPRHTSVGALVFESWARQQCRPHFDQDAAKKFNGEATFVPVGGRARAAGPSVCTFCVDVCRSEHVITGNGETLTELQFRDAQCVGSSNSINNSKPINAVEVEAATNAANTFDLFDEDTHFLASTYAWEGATEAFSSNNFYSTSLMTQSKHNTDGTVVSRTFEISNLQAEQIMNGLATNYGTSDAGDLTATGATVDNNIPERK